MSMQRFPATEDDAPTQVFDDLYAEAKRFVLEHNDMDAAMACLSLVQPQSQSHWWRWTDFMAALLFRKGE